MNSFNTSVAKGHYSITFETDDKNNYEEVERLCRRITDNKARTIPIEWIIEWDKKTNYEFYDYIRQVGENIDVDSINCVKFKEFPGLWLVKRLLYDWEKENARDN